MSRVVVLVNKDFEYTGFIEGLRNTVNVHAGTNGRQAECRFRNMIADIYCIQNLFKPGENSSNSEVKYNYLKELFKSHAFCLDDVDAILSVSTAESTPVNQGFDGSLSRNGSVFVGHKFFLSDQSEHDATTQSHLPIGTESTLHTEHYDAGAINNGLYDLISAIPMQFKKAPNNSDINPKCCAGHSFTSVGVVNVMDYACYHKADEAAYNQARFDGDPMCIETTHGVVVKALHNVREGRSVPQVVFISPIVDRYLKFDEDVDGKYGKQNFVCSYNGGVTVGHMLRVLNTFLK